MIWMIRSGVGKVGHCSYVAPCMYTISGVSFVGRPHCVVLCCNLVSMVSWCCLGGFDVGYLHNVCEVSILLCSGLLGVHSLHHSILRKCIALQTEDDICICGELCLLNINGHVRGDGWYEWVSWKVVISE